MKAREFAATVALVAAAVVAAGVFVAVAGFCWGFGCGIAQAIWAM